MAKRMVSLWAVPYVLLAASGALCQNLRQSIPDAPSVRGVAPAQRCSVLFEGELAVAKFGAIIGRAGTLPQAGFAGPEKALFSQKGSSNVFRQFLNSSVPKRQSGYHSSSSASLMGRAAYAGSRIFIRRDEFGKRRPNMLYLLRALTSAAAATASRPYWRRSIGEPFGDFGSTVGDDAGMNLWHEFKPDIERLMKRYAPGFLSKIKWVDHRQSAARTQLSLP